jgi:ABC-2 type transport system ATP-binding protein
MTARDNVDLAAYLRPGFDRSIAMERFAQLRISLNARVGSLSGGQQAQVMLAIAFGVRAPILLLDEPLASLDPLARRDFLHLVRNAARESGTTVLLTSHIVSDIEELCSHVAVIGTGQLLFLASIRDALASHGVASDLPKDPTAALVSAFTDRDGTTQVLSRVTTNNEASGSLELAPVSLEQIVLGYLSAARAALAETAR